MIDALRSLCRDIYGPEGASCVVRSNSNNKVTLSSCGSRLLRAFQEFPLPGVVVKNTGFAQHQTHGDGGLTCTLLACVLIRRTYDLGLDRRADHALFADTFHTCLHWCFEFLESSDGTNLLQTERSLGDENDFAAVARSVLFPKLLGVPDPHALHVISEALRQRFGKAKDGQRRKGSPQSHENDKRPGERELNQSNQFETTTEKYADGLRVLRVTGAPTERTKVLHGVFVARLPIPGFDWGGFDDFRADTPRRDGKRVLVLMEAVSSVTQTEFAKSSETVYREIANACLALSVDAVLCRQTLDRGLTELLLQHDILPLERVNEQEILVVTEVTGATPVFDWRSCRDDDFDLENDFDFKKSSKNSRNAASFAKAWRAKLGVCGDISLVTVMDTKYVNITPPSEKVCFANGVAFRNTTPTDTLALCAPTELELDELNEAVDQLRVVASRLLVEGDFVAANGAVELALAKHVRKKGGVVMKGGRSTREASRTAAAVSAFAEALEDVAFGQSGSREKEPLSLVSRVPRDARLASCRDAVDQILAKSTLLFPTEEEERKARRRDECLESLSAKMDGIRKAVEVAAVVLRSEINP